MAVKALHAENSRSVHQRLRPRWIAPQCGRCVLQRLQSLLNRAFRCKRNIHERLRPVSAEVADRADLPIRNGYQCASRISNHCPPQREMFHPADVVAELYRVAHNVLVFEHDVEARDDVSDQSLSSEAHRQAGKTCKSYRRQDIDFENAQRRQQRHYPDNLAPRTVQHPGQRTRLLFALLCRSALSRCVLDYQIAHRTHYSVQEQRDNKNSKKKKCVRKRQLQPVIQGTRYDFDEMGSITLEAHRGSILPASRGWSCTEGG